VRRLALDGRPAFRADLWARDQYFQAITEWRAIRDQRPKDLDARLSLARAFVKAGDLDAAVQEYQAVLQLDPGNKAVAGELLAAQRARR